jgi:hypothetical protein
LVAASQDLASARLRDAELLSAVTAIYDQLPNDSAVSPLRSALLQLEASHQTIRTALCDAGQVSEAAASIGTSSDTLAATAAVLEHTLQSRDIEHAIVAAADQTRASLDQATCVATSAAREAAAAADACSDVVRAATSAASSLEAHLGAVQSDGARTCASMEAAASLTAAAGDNCVRAVATAAQTASTISSAALQDCLRQLASLGARQEQIDASLAQSVASLAQLRGSVATTKAVFAVVLTLFVSFFFFLTVSPRS